MSDYSAEQPVSIKVTGKVIRCGCTETQKQEDDWHGHLQTVCPNPKAVEDLGLMSFAHKNPFKVLAWKLVQLWNKLIKLIKE